MKKTVILFALSILAFGGLSAQSKAKAKPTTLKKAAAPATFVIDPALSTVAWEGKKVGGKHNGFVKIENGAIATSGTNIVAGNVHMDMNSITCEDIKDAEYNAKLVGHLKSEDFFNVAAFPHAMLDIIAAKPLGARKYRITGNLNIKGIMQPITFDAQTTSSNPNQLSAKARIVFDRTKYDVKYGSTLFGAAVDKAIEDKVTLDINIVANKK